MTISYSRSDAEFLRNQREKADPFVDLVLCKDGLWRTPDEKIRFEESGQRGGVAVYWPANSF